MVSIQSQMRNMYVDNQLLMAASSLEIAAKEAKNPLQAALALIKQGEALRAELHYNVDDLEMEVVKSQIAQAEKAYENAIDKAKGEKGAPPFIAMARFGLGLCAEEVGDFAKAREIYESIATNSELEGTVFPVQAQFRLEIMEDTRGKFVFVKAPEQVESLIPESIGTIESEAGNTDSTESESAEDLEKSVGTETESTESEVEQP